MFSGSTYDCNCVKIIVRHKQSRKELMIWHFIRE